MRVSKTIPNFNTGEISPKMTARVDFEKYHAALERLDNFIVLPQGPVTKRCGTKFILETKDSTKKSRLVKFQFNITDAYAMEVGEYYIRLFKNKARVGSVEIVTPYGENDIWDLKFEQSFDVLYIFSPNYWPRKLSRSGTDDTVQANWDISIISFDPPPSYVENTDLAQTCVPGTAGDATQADAEDVEFDATGSNTFLEADIGRAIIFGSSRAIITDIANAGNSIVKTTIRDSWPDETEMASSAWFLTGSPVAAIKCSDKSPVGKEIKVIAIDNDETPHSVSLAYSGTTIT